MIYLLAGLLFFLAGCAPTVAPLPPPPTVVPATSTLPPTATFTPTATRIPPTPTPDLSAVEASPVFTITVLYDNIAYNARLQMDWGFACLVQGPEQTLLFDTGGNGEILLQNMRVLGFSPQLVDAVVISHAHSDHTGGLAGFLAENPRVTVYMLAAFPAALKETVRRAGAALVEVDGPTPIGAWAHSTGALGVQLREQALVIETPRGAVVVAGCAHPGIAALTREAQAVVGGDIYLTLGGFHLGNANTTQIATTIADLQALGVQHIAPSHCTGDAARRAFATAFGPAYLESGAGRVFVIALEE